MKVIHKGFKVAPFRYFCANIDMKTVKNYLLPPNSLPIHDAVIFMKFI